MKLRYGRGLALAGAACGCLCAVATTYAQTVLEGIVVKSTEASEQAGGSAGTETATGPVKGIVATRSATGTKTDTPLIETSQSISVITADRIDQQGATSVSEALGYTAGVRGSVYGVDTRFDWLSIVVMDNASSHKTKRIRDWFARRPHWHTHFPPTSSSWINQVEHFFALLAEKQIKRGAHTSVKERIAAIEAFICRQNENPKPLRWTKPAADILASIERFCRRTLDVHAPAG